MKLCSACLLGVKCRYDGRAKTNKKVLALDKKEELVPICPEQLGGLSTPREPAETIGDGFAVTRGEGKVITKTGQDVTKAFMQGAQLTVQAAKIFEAKEMICKSKSPSCGCGKIYDGTFKGKLINGDGVTTALLKQNGIKCISEDDLSKKR